MTKALKVWYNMDMEYLKTMESPIKKRTPEQLARRARIRMKQMEIKPITMTPEQPSKGGSQSPYKEQKKVA